MPVRVRSVTCAAADACSPPPRSGAAGECRLQTVAYVANLLVQRHCLFSVSSAWIYESRSNPRGEGRFFSNPNWRQKRSPPCALYSTHGAPEVVACPGSKLPNGIEPSILKARVRLGWGEARRALAPASIESWVLLGCGGDDQCGASTQRQSLSSDDRVALCGVFPRPCGV